MEALEAEVTAAEPEATVDAEVVADNNSSGVSL